MSAFYCVNFCVRPKGKNARSHQSAPHAACTFHEWPIRAYCRMSSARPLNCIEVYGWILFGVSLSMHMCNCCVYFDHYVFWSANALKNENSLSLFENGVHKQRNKGQEKNQYMQCVHAIAFNPKSGILSSSKCIQTNCRQPVSGNSNLPPNHRKKCL